VASKDVLKYFRNLLQGGDGTSAKKSDEDLDIFWMSKGGSVDLSKWSKVDFSTGLIPDYMNCKYFAGRPMATNDFGLCFAAKEKVTTFFHLVTEKKIQSPVGTCQKKLISDPVLANTRRPLSATLFIKTQFSSLTSVICKIPCSSLCIETISLWHGLVLRIPAFLVSSDHASDNLNKIKALDQTIVDDV